MSAIINVIRTLKGQKDEYKNEHKKEEKPRYPGTVPPLRPQLHKDKFMCRVNVDDNIIPIWEAETQESERKTSRASTEVLLEYSYSLEDYIKESSIPTERSLSSYDDDFIRLSDTEEEEDIVRGVFLDSVPSTREHPGILDPECHPIYIEGVAVQGGNVTCIDMSPYSDQFWILDYEWFAGIDQQCPERYRPEPIGMGEKLNISWDLLGKYIFCRAHRRVELQTQNDPSAKKVGVYDPHVNVSKNAGYLPEPKFHDISSWCSIGPVSMCHEWCLEILRCLSEGICSSRACLSYNEELSRDFSKMPSDRRDHGRVILTIDYSSLKIEDHRENETTFTIKNIKKLYNAGALEVQEDSITIYYSDFEMEDAGSLSENLLISIHKCDTMLLYLCLQFNNAWSRALFVWTLSIFRLQEKLGREPSDWNSKHEKADAEGLNDFIRRHIFLSI